MHAVETRTPGDELELTVGAPAAGGGFVARTPDGQVVFVRHAIAGERVLARITEATTRYLRADAIEVLEPSPDRITPACSFAGPGRCGGCDYQHIDLGAQRLFKAHRIRELLASIAGIDADVEVRPVPGDAAGLASRTRVDLAVSRNGRPGFHRYRSHEVVEVDACPLEVPELAALGVERLRWPGARAIEAHASALGERVLSIDARAKLDLPEIDADLVVNGHARRGGGIVIHEVLGHRFRVSPGVFWQVHPGAATTLTNAVLLAAGDVEGRHLLDCYCGAGLFTVALAHAVGERGSVVGIEENSRAVRDARKNAAHLANVSVLLHPVTAASLLDLSPPPEIVVLDPPRTGAGKQVISALSNLDRRPERVVYVSCDVATFARDTRVLLDNGFHLEGLAAYDCFPMTEHVELVATFSSLG